MVSCYLTLCPHPDKESPGGPNESARAELQEDVNAYPLTVQVTNPTTGVVESGVATICQRTGVVDSGKYCCIDPTGSGSFTAGNGKTAGNYVQVVDYYYDVRACNCK